jgi:hypothetical protein
MKLSTRPNTQKTSNAMAMIQSRAITSTSSATFVAHR